MGSLFEQYLRPTRHRLQNLVWDFAFLRGNSPLEGINSRATQSLSKGIKDPQIRYLPETRFEGDG